MRITSVRGTDLFTGPSAAPRQIVEVTLAGARPAPVRVRVHGPSVSTPVPVIAGPGDEQAIVEVGVIFAAPVREGTPCQVTAVAEASTGRVTLDGTVIVAETGWTMWLISHFPTIRCGGTRRRASPTPGWTCRWLRRSGCLSSAPRSTWYARTWRRPARTRITVSCWPKWIT